MPLFSCKFLRTVEVTLEATDIKDAETKALTVANNPSNPDTKVLSIHLIEPAPVDPNTQLEGVSAA